MKNEIIGLNDKEEKVMGITDDQIIVSSKRHKDMDSLLAATIKSGMLETIKVIPLTDLRELSYNKKDERLHLKYEKKGKQKSDSLLLTEVEMREPLAEYLAGTKNFSRQETQESTTKPLIINILITLAVPVFFWQFRDMAIAAQHGEHYEATGRRRGAAQFLANIVETLGPTWVTVIGAAVLVYMIYYTYQRFKKPSTIVSYN